MYVDFVHSCRSVSVELIVINVLRLIEDRVLVSVRVHRKLHEISKVKSTIQNIETRIELAVWLTMRDVQTIDKLQ